MTEPTRDELVEQMKASIQNAEYLREVAIPGVTQKVSPDAIENENEK